MSITNKFESQRRKNNLSLLKEEWKSLFKNKKLLIAVIGVLFIPLMYSGGYLSAFWDPYGKLDQLPVAVVNQDTGTTFEEEELDVGGEVVDNLKENESFDWHFVNKEEAEKGLQDHKYYMVIEIPKDFSENATTLLDDEPKQLGLTFTTNKGYNFISGQIGESAVAKIKEEVANSLTKTYAESLFDNIELMAEGISDASEGATKINDGVSELQEGSKSLDENLHELVTKAVMFKDGLNEASNGSTQLSNGLSSVNSGLSAMQQGQSELYDGAVQTENGTGNLVKGLEQSLSGMEELEAALPQLTAGTDQLNESAPQLVEGTKQLAEGNESASEGADSLSQNISALTDTVNQLATTLEQAPLNEEQQKQILALVEALNSIDAGGKQLATNLHQLADGANILYANVEQFPENTSKLHEGTASVENTVQQLTAGQKELYNGAVQINDAQSQMSQGLKTFGEKIGEAKDGVEQLENGGKELDNGIHELASGSITLEDGTEKLADGANSLNSGVTELSDGTNELSSKLSDASNDTKDVKGSEAQYDMIADPVNLETKELNKVSNYGTGLAPYFLSLALFVGSLLVTVVFPLRDTAGKPKLGISLFTSKFSVLGIVAIIQALLADLVLLYGLGLEVKSVGYFILFTMLTSLTFMAIVQFLVTTMDNPGRFIAIIVLILQLTTSAGTFPVELLPEVFQKINHWLPMTYSVEGFRSIISIGDFGTMWEQMYKLAGMMLLMMIGTILYFSRKVKKDRVHVHHELSENV